MTSKSLGDQEIAEILSPFQVRVTHHQIAMIREYIAILLRWNRSVSLTTVIEPREIIARHFGESMYASATVPVETGRLADVGTGAGFPGLAMKIMAADLIVTLVESNKKKCVFLSEIVRTLGLGSIHILPVRFEDLPTDPDRQFDYITARALGGHGEFLRTSKRHLRPGGRVLLWLGGEDVGQVAQKPEWIWQPAIRIPDSQRRFILMGRSRSEAIHQ